MKGEEKRQGGGGCFSPSLSASPCADSWSNRPGPSVRPEAVSPLSTTLPAGAGLDVKGSCESAEDPPSPVRVRGS